MKRERNKNLKRNVYNEIPRLSWIVFALRYLSGLLFDESSRVGYPFKESGSSERFPIPLMPG
jgi:hypothetical protein